MEIHERHADQAPALGNANKARKIQKRGPEAKPQALYRMSGADLTQIDAIGVETVEMVIREYGPDLSCFPTEKQFVAHATRAPHVAQSGGQPLPKKVSRCKRYILGTPTSRASSARGRFRDLPD